MDESEEVKRFKDKPQGKLRKLDSKKMKMLNIG
jgi:hypothetical protein